MLLLVSNRCDKIIMDDLRSYNLERKPIKKQITLWFCSFFFYFLMICMCYFFAKRFVNKLGKCTQTSCTYSNTMLKLDGGFTCASYASSTCCSWHYYELPMTHYITVMYIIIHFYFFFYLFSKNITIFRDNISTTNSGRRKRDYM